MTGDQVDAEEEADSTVSAKLLHGLQATHGLGLQEPQEAHSLGRKDDMGWETV